MLIVTDFGDTIIFERANTQGSPYSSPACPPFPLCGTLCPSVNSIRGSSFCAQKLEPRMLKKSTPNLFCEGFRSKFILRSRGMVGKRAIRFWVDIEFNADSDPTLRDIGIK
ncbi:MAG: hypothetical protein DRR16_20075 [Candidatus Parabeggiatoa sp. nov. 3]|nr:MAG: hypothetical protein DRR00_30815 [Gammaproteobacteria bacterium]RKZ55979.1 MAG: hypothetical protein DRQ99_29280 [Gammaproteobacteria bacterium]RKZ82276.1 MAG: hypothetical protein DRR16_20075 [Gammaproteobacteria bacterium]